MDGLLDRLTIKFHSNLKNGVYEMLKAKKITRQDTVQALLVAIEKEIK